MQEGMKVDPLSVQYVRPFGARIFLLYLVVITIMTAIRSVRLVRYLWSSRPSSIRRSSEASEKKEEDFLHSWVACSRAVQSTKRLTILTLLLTALLAVNQFRVVFFITLEKRYGVVDSSSISQALVLLLIGMLVSTALYATCSISEGALERRKLKPRKPGFANRCPSCGGEETEAGSKFADR